MAVDAKLGRLVMPVPPLSLYIHFPWCIKKCPYCDFNSHAVKDTLPEQRYVEALLTDLQQDVAWMGAVRPITSIFMGGGTPSLFAPEAIERLLRGVRQQLPVTDDCEITLEANPGTFESDKFRAYRQLGINRLSIGIQSFNSRHLQGLGRVHSAEEALRAVAIAQSAGFDNLNLDLMFGLPDQSEAEALADIDTAIALKPSHLSFYQLTLEPNTYFHRYPPALPEDEVLYAVQQACQQRLAAAGFEQYEVSAYAQAGRQARHNRHYWQFGDYLGIGAGAHGKVTRSLPGEIVRTVKPKSPEQYLTATQRRTEQMIAEEALPLEFVMNHLRLKRGFLLADYMRLTGLPTPTLQPALADCLAKGLLVQDGDRVRCSAKGWDFLDAVLQHFVL